jgi:DMSO/TMAO reductase YedYZ molybdopterin-dependent catalytic subunit
MSIKNRQKAGNRNGMFMAGLAAVMAVTVIALVAMQPYSPVTPLPSAEIREYEGKRLSSINDFRENSIKGPQYIKISDYMLAVNGLVENPKNFAYEEVIAFPRYSKVVTLFCTEGWDATILWEGIKIEDLLAEVGVKDSANTVIFHAYDGYTSSLPLDFITDNDILLAYKMNGVVIPPERGFPFQVVAEDKWGYKWVKWVTGIELSDDPDYGGFWEGRGYSDEGDLSGSKFD